MSDRCLRGVGGHLRGGGGDDVGGSGRRPRSAVDIRRRVTGADGSASISMIVLVPVTLVLMTIGVQAALGAHARTEARLVAQEVAALVGRAGLDSAEAVDLASAVLADQTDLDDVEVDVVVDAELVVVTVRGRAPGLVEGLASPVDVHGVVAREGWRP